MQYTAATQEIVADFLSDLLKNENDNQGEKRKVLLLTWTLTSHDGMQWMFSGFGYHFFIPVQTML